MVNSVDAGDLGGTVVPAGQVAQLVEHGIENAGVGGSSPPLPIDSERNESQYSEGIGIHAGPFSVCEFGCSFLPFGAVGCSAVLCTTSAPHFAPRVLSSGVLIARSRSSGRTIS